jgi:hypothetical protein
MIAENLNIAQIGFAPGGFSPLYLLIIGGTMVVSMLISGMLKRRFREYSQIPIRMTGAQIAEAMLRQNGITDVQVISVPGQLTDHYDPIKKTVNLSEPVYHVNSVAAAAVAAHECGHALQHQQAYVWLGFRSKMVPAVELSSKALNFIMIAGILGIGLDLGGTFCRDHVVLDCHPASRVRCEPPGLGLAGKQRPRREHGAREGEKRALLGRDDLRCGGRWLGRAVALFPDDGARQTERVTVWKIERTGMNARNSGVIPSDLEA